MNKNLPTLDDPDLRKRQFVRYTEGMGELGDYAKELKKSTKINLWISIIFTFVFLSLILLGVFYQYTHGGLDSILDTDMVVRRFDCSNGIYNDTVRTYQDMDFFIKNYGGECKLYRVK